MLLPWCDGWNDVDGATEAGGILAKKAVQHDTKRQVSRYHHIATTCTGLLWTIVMICYVVGVNV